MRKTLDHAIRTKVSPDCNISLNSMGVLAINLSVCPAYLLSFLSTTINRYPDSYPSVVDCSLMSEKACCTHEAFDFAHLGETIHLCELSEMLRSGVRISPDARFPAEVCSTSLKFAAMCDCRWIYRVSQANLTLLHPRFPASP